MRIPHVRFRIWHLMAIVAITGLMAAGYVSVFPPEPQASSHTLIWRHNYYVTLEIAGYVFPHTSPAFWIVSGFALSVVIGLLVGLIAIIVRATKVLRRRTIRNT